MFVWLISHQPAVLFSQNKPATSNQPTVLFSQKKSAPATNQQYFSLGTNQPPTISQQYFSLRKNQHQPPVTSQTNRPRDSSPHFKTHKRKSLEEAKCCHYS
jgi:hypothetical protein